MAKKSIEVELQHEIRTYYINRFRRLYPNQSLSSLAKPSNPLEERGVKLDSKEMAQIDMHPITMSVICGTLFGDSSLDKGGATPRMQGNHSSRQAEWFLWKVLVGLEGFVLDTGIRFKLPDGKQPDAFDDEGYKIGGELYGKFHYATSRVCPRKAEIKKLFDIIATPHKTYARFWLNHMNAYFLMTLWFDDGSLSSYGRVGELCLYAVPKEQLEVFANYLKSVWNVECIIEHRPSKATRTNPDPYGLRFNQEQLMSLLLIIAPIVPVESMLYKVCFTPIDSSLRQRWATDLKAVVKEEWHATIDATIAYNVLARTKAQKN